MPTSVRVDSFERVLWWLFVSSVGAATRMRVLLAIREAPRNTKRLAEALGLDYTSVRHHLKVLRKNGLVVTAGEHYGQVYFLSSTMESRWENLERILMGTAHGRARGVRHGTG